MADKFQTELKELINRHSMENGSDTPDFILAQFLSVCLAAYDDTLSQRELWHGRRLGRHTDIPNSG